jgi:hypothetical protein
MWVTWGSILLVIFLLFLFLLPVILIKMKNMKKKERKLITLEELALRGKTGDLLLFNGGDLVSRLWFGCEFTHVGVLVILSEKCYVWEYTKHNFRTSLKDEITGQISREGPQLVLLQEKLRTYGGYCVIRHLSPSLEEKFGKEEVIRRFQELWKEFSADNYSIDIPSFSLAILEEKFRGIIDSRTASKNDFVCTDIVRATYAKFDVFNPEHFEKKSFSFPLDYTFEILGNMKFETEEHEIITLR